MSTTYIVKAGDTFGEIVLKAMKENPYLTPEQMERANSHIKNFSMIRIGETIIIPDAKPKPSSLSAAPIEGKCGNEFTYIPVGERATMISVSGELNGKSTPNLEPCQTYTLEREKIEESRQGSLCLRVDGMSFSLIDDISPYKEKINAHKDVKVSLTVIDKEWLVPVKPEFQIPEFRSLDQDATMTGEEFLASMQAAQPKIRTLKDLGINLPSVEKHTIITYEIPPELPIEEGVKNIDTMSDEEIEKLTDAIIAGGKKASATLVATLISLGGTSKKRIFWKQQLWKGKFKITPGLNGSKLIHFYGTPSLKSMLKGVTDPKMIEKIKKAAINPGTKYKMGKGFSGIQLKASMPFFESTKLGYLEKFLSGKTAAGGVVISSIFSGTVETYKWYHNKERQDIDLLAIWGVVVFESAIGAGIIYAAVALAIGTFGLTSIVVTIGIGIVFAVIGSFAIEGIATYLDINNKSIQAVRSARDIVQEFVNDTSDLIPGRDATLDKSLHR